jgi:uncharacterized protein YjbJ (UPF0337 family)
MNEDVFAGQWRELRGTLKSWWGNLSDDDLEWIAGEKDRLVGLIQQKYGWTREQAQQDVDRRFSEYPDAARSLSDIKAKTYALGEQAAGKARDALSAATDGLESAKSYIKRNDFSAMASDLGEIVRKYPVYSLLIGAGIIYLLSRSARR